MNEDFDETERWSEDIDYWETMIEYDELEVLQEDFFYERCAKCDFCFLWLDKCGIDNLDGCFEFQGISGGINCNGNLS